MLDLTSIQVLQGKEKFQLEVEELLSPLYLCTFEFVLLCITRSLWALRARLLVGGPSGRFRPFGLAFSPSGLLTP